MSAILDHFSFKSAIFSRSSEGKILQKYISAEIETVSEKCKNLKTHLKAVRDELNNNLSMRQMRQNEVNTEKVTFGAREQSHHKTEIGAKEI